MGGYLQDSQNLKMPFSFSIRQWLMMLFVFIGLTWLGIYSIYIQVEGATLRWDWALLSPAVLLSAVSLFLIYSAADGLRLWFTLKALGYHVSLVAMTKLVFLNVFVSNITPLATGGGVAQVWYLKQHGVSIGKGLTATTIRTVLAMLFIFSAAPILWWLYPSAPSLAKNGIFITLLITVFVYISMFVMLIWRTHYLIRPLIGLLSFIHKLNWLSDTRFTHLKRHWIREMRRFGRGFGEYLSGPITYIIGSILFTLIFLMALFSFPVLLFWGLGYDLDYWISLAKMLMTTFIMYFSPTPGASGIAEGVFGRLFAGDISGAHLVLGVIAWRVWTIYLSMMIGLVITIRLLSQTIKQPLPTKE